MAASATSCGSPRRRRGIGGGDLGLVVHPGAGRAHRADRHQVHPYAVGPPLEGHRPTGRFQARLGGRIGRQQGSAPRRLRRDVHDAALLASVEQGAGDLAARHHRVAEVAGHDPVEGGHVELRGAVVVVGQVPADDVDQVPERPERRRQPFDRRDQSVLVGDVDHGGGARRAARLQERTAVGGMLLEVGEDADGGPRTGCGQRHGGADAATSSSHDEAGPAGEVDLDRHRAPLRRSARSSGVRGRLTQSLLAGRCTMIGVSGASRRRTSCGCRSSMPAWPRRRGSPPPPPRRRRGCGFRGRGGGAPRSPSTRSPRRRPERR